MTKAELIDKIAAAACPPARQAGTSKASANRMLDALTDELTKALRKGDKITLPGLGTFSVAKRARRKGRNPQTGEVITIPASKVPKFRPAARLKEAVGRKRR